MYINGCQVGFYRGDVKLLMEDIGALKPTVFPTVPRLLNRVYDKVHQFFSHDHIENKSDKNKRFSGWDRTRNVLKTYSFTSEKCFK